MTRFKIVLSTAIICICRRRTAIFWAIKFVCEKQQVRTKCKETISEDIWLIRMSLFNSFLRSPNWFFWAIKFVRNKSSIFAFGSQCIRQFSTKLFHSAKTCNQIKGSKNVHGYHFSLFNRLIKYLNLLYFKKIITIISIQIRTVWLFKEPQIHRWATSELLHTIFFRFLPIISKTYRFLIKNYW